MVYRCKKEYFLLGYKKFSVNIDYIYVQTTWRYIRLVDDYVNETNIPINLIHDYFYTEKELLILKRKEKIDKLVNK